MKKTLLSTLILILCLLGVQAKDKTVTVKLYHTTDVHGNFFPFDFINNRNNKGSFARVSTFINEQRAQYGDNVLLFDGGDLLQGQPSVYYYNFVDTLSAHICAEVMNYLKYDAAVMGNHDIEAGHAVYDRWVEDCRFPVLGANILNEAGETYLPPYAIFEKAGVKIVVLGMITEAIPAWLPGNLWSGLTFAGIEETAKKWLPIIKETEKPDLVVGLLHSGVKTNFVAGYKESVGLELAAQVPGFDVIFCGHDHSPFNQKVASVIGDSVLVINPGAGANRICEVTLEVTKKKKKTKQISISGELRDISGITPDEAYLTHFNPAIVQTKAYVNEEIGEFTHAISSREAFFGPSPFVDLLHTLQLKLTDADVSFVAPLSQNAYIGEGKVYMRDMFNLYRYENLLYTMHLTGKEIHGALEFCYGIWVNQMTSADDHLLQIEPNERYNNYRFVNPSYLFDSAAGIIYTADVTKSVGERVKITSLANGAPFDENKTYKVAVNSYQGSGGGGILTDGSGIPKEKLSERVIYSTDKDLRYYLAEEIRRQKIVTPQPLNQWRFIPEEWVKPAADRDYKLLFGK